MARLAVLAMCSRGVALSEFELLDEVQAVTITVRRPRDGQQPEVELELFGTSGVAIGAVDL